MSQSLPFRASSNSQESRRAHHSCDDGDYSLGLMDFDQQQDHQHLGYQMPDVLAHSDQLRRELQRKDSRNDKLMKELKQMRKSYDHQQVLNI